MAFVKDSLPVQIGQVPDSITLSLLVSVKCRIIFSPVVIIGEKEVPVLIIVTTVYKIVLVEVISLL